MVRRGVRIALCAVGVVLIATPSQAAPPEDAAKAVLARGVVAGRVTDSDGAPVGDLSVRLVVRGRWSRAESREVRTAADGRYRCENVPPGDVAAFVADRGLVARGMADFLSADAGPLGRTLRAGGTASIDLVVERGAKVTGRVLLDDGAPLAGTAVDAVPTDDREREAPFVPPSISTRTASDGGFTLEGLVPGLAYDVSVMPDGAPAYARPRISAGVSAAAPLVIRLPRLREVRLAVVGEAAPHPPIPGARARVRHGGEDSGGALGREVLTDAQGRARILVPEGEKAAVRVEAPGRGSALLEPIPAGDEVVVRLAPLRTIAGRVLLPDGTPAARVDVGVLIAFSGDGAIEARTGEDGRFTIAGIPPGLFVVAAGLRTPEGTLLRAMTRAEAGAKDVVLRLETVREPSRAALRIQAIGPDGTRVSSAFVAVQTTGGGSVASGMSGGSVTLDLGELPPRVGGIEGASVLVALPEDEHGAPLPFGPAVVGPLAADVTALDVRLPAERVLTGRVRGHDDAPVVGARVYVGVPQFSGDDVRRQLGAGGRAGIWACERTDAEGMFRAHGLPDEDLGVSVSPPLPFTPRATVRVPRGTSHVEVIVEAAGKTEVTVLDSAGAPVVGARVCALAKGDRCPSDSASTDARGVAAVTGVRAGKRYVLRVEPSWDFLVWTQAEWDPAPTTVRLERAYELSGTVRASDGTPIARAFVQHDDAGTERWARSVETDAQGRFQFQRLKAGPLVLSAELGDRLAGSETVPGPVTLRTVRAEAGARDVVLLLDPGRTVEILPPAGAPEGAKIYVHCTRGTHGFWGLRTVSREGRILVEGLMDDDRLTIFMPPDTTGRSVAHVATPAQSPIRLNRRVEGTIRGRVVLPTGAVGARLHAVAERFEAALDARADATGRYEIRGVPEGWSWTLHASTEVNGVKHEGSLEHVQRGEAPDLVLRAVR